MLDHRQAAEQASERADDRNLWITNAPIYALYLPAPHSNRGIAVVRDRALYGYSHSEMETENLLRGQRPHVPACPLLSGRETSAKMEISPLQLELVLMHATQDERATPFPFIEGPSIAP